jgi:hypothetical protein
MRVLPVARTCGGSPRGACTRAPGPRHTNKMPRPLLVPLPDLFGRHRPHLTGVKPKLVRVKGAVSVVVHATSCLIPSSRSISVRRRSNNSIRLNWRGGGVVRALCWTGRIAEADSDLHRRSDRKDQPDAAQGGHAKLVEAIRHRPSLPNKRINDQALAAFRGSIECRLTEVGSRPLSRSRCLPPALEPAHSRTLLASVRSSRDCARATVRPMQLSDDDAGRAYFVGHRRWLTVTNGLPQS